MRSFLSVAAALAAMQLVAAQDPFPACVVECAVDARGKFGELGCTSAEDRTCLCQNENFGFSIRDCAVPKCGATIENVNNYLSQQFCPGVSPVVPSSAPAAAESTVPPAEETSAPPAEETSAPPAEETSAPPAEETSAPAETTSEPAPTSAPETSEAPATTSAEPAEETATTTEAPATETSAPSTETTAETSETTASESAAATGSSDSDEDKNEKDDDSEEVGAGGLSTGAKAGIAIGVIAVVIAILGLVLCLLGRRKNQAKPTKRAPLQISHPVSNTGPAYRGSDDDTYEKYGDIEMTTRYEDMVPRTQPRTMV
jgi:hypothetical protein